MQADQTYVIISIVEECVCRMYDLPEFMDVAFSNIAEATGRERELYPYLNVLLLDAARMHFGQTGVRGIGSGELSKKQPNCLLVLTRNACIRISAIEIKGPSKDLPYVGKGQDEDIRKLQGLVNEGVIDLGISVGLSLNDPGKQGVSVSRNGQVLSIHMEIKRTEPRGAGDELPARLTHNVGSRK